MKVLITNLAPEATDEELKAFLIKYGFPAFDEIERFAGDASRPAVLVKFLGAFPEQLEPLRRTCSGDLLEGPSSGH